jgi:hypothetical protein
LVSHEACLHLFLDAPCPADGIKELRRIRSAAAPGMTARKERGAQRPEENPDSALGPGADDVPLQPAEMPG